MSKNESVLGIYSSRSSVENAISALRDSGFSNSDVSVLLPENLAPGNWRQRRKQKRLRGQLPAQAQEQ
jgi:hypothetical protein